METFFDRNKLYLKTALEHKAASPRRKQETTLEDEMMRLASNASRNPPYKKYDTIDSIDIANVQNEVLNKQEF